MMAKRGLQPECPVSTAFSGGTLGDAEPGGLQAGAAHAKLLQVSLGSTPFFVETLSFRIGISITETRRLVV